ncbi:MAG: GlcG/HbpS family heme-binding protein [Burkholderiales bacterium]
MFLKKLMRAILLCSAILAGGMATTASALESKPVLSIEAAEKMALACDRYANSKGWKVNIAVLDDGGGLLYFRRHPASFRGSVDIAINKAWTATQFGFPSRFFGSTIIKAAPGIELTPRLIIFPGGLPVKVGDALVGGIGVSGVTGDQDEECAQVGLDAAKDLLK